MRPIGEMTRSIWWAIAAAGVAALAAAAVVAADLVGPTSAVGAWLLVTGAVILVASMRAPGGIRAALPFGGGAIVALLLGAVSFVLPASESSSSIVMVGLWCLVFGAGCYAVSRIAAAARVPATGLYVVGWVGILAGIGISTLPVFGFRASALPVAFALAVAGAIMIVGSRLLQVLPDEPAPVLSKRETRRQERSGRR